jgi:Ca2+-binding RTX toxin-like protein
MRKRIALLLGTVVALVLVVAAGVAFAAVLTGDQNDNTIFGTSAIDDITGAAGSDTLVGRTGGDVMYGDSGDDGVRGNMDSDYVDGGRGSDTVNGGDGNGDVVNVVDGTSLDTAIGGPGTSDICIIDALPGPQRDTVDESCEIVLETQQQMAAN